MADNSTTPSSGGLPVASDDIGSFQYQRVKTVYGPDGTNRGDVDILNPLPIQACPILCDGIFRVSAISGTYSGLTGPSAPLISFRNAHATKVIAILECEIMVYTTTAAASGGIVDRQLNKCTGWTVADSGGTDITPTTQNKLRTSQPSSIMTAGDFRITSGGTLTAGTRTVETNPIASAFGWAPPQHTGTELGGGGGAPTNAAWSTVGANKGWYLVDAIKGGGSALYLAQNEGFIIRVGQTMPGSLVQRTCINLTWAEGVV